MQRRRYPSLFTSVLLILFSSGAAAQETFQYIGGPGSQNWQEAANWSGGSGMFSSYPGETPEAGTRDSANLTGARTADLDLRVTGNLALDVLRFGSTTFDLTETVISGAPGATLTVDRIEPAGSIVSQNILAVDILLDGSLDITNATTGLTVTGQIINGNPMEDVFRTIENETDQTLLVEGDVVLSNDANNAGHLRFINQGVSETQILGEITDGDAPGGRVTYAKGNFDMRSDSSYTGITQLGENDPNVGSIHVIHTDRPFGYGRLVIGGGNELKVIRPAFGKGTRMLDNDIQIAREVAFDSNEDIILNGTLYQSNGRELINDIVPSKSLIINGDVYASNSEDIREWNFNGQGTTIVNGIIDDSLGHPQVSGASLGKNGSGRLILTNPAVAAYDGPTTVREGILQLGDGGDAVNLNDDTVSGDGILEIDHAGTMTFGPSISGDLTVRHVGSGETTLNRVSTGSGNLMVSDGTLLVDAGEGTTSGTGSGNVLVNGGALGGNGHVGGHVTVNQNGTIAPGPSVGTFRVDQLDLQQAGTLEIELAGTNPGEFDQLHVANNLNLNGLLDVSLDQQFSLAPGMSFEIVDIAGTRSGEFAGLGEGAVVGNFGLDLFLTYAGDDGNDVVLYTNTGSTTSGDFDDDGDVDGRDFLLWQRGESPDPHSTSDLADWRANYGSGTAAEVTAVVPEPTNCLMLLVAVVGLCSQRWSTR